MNQARRLSSHSVSTRYAGDSASREDMEQSLVDMGLSATSFAPRLACSSQNDE
jgi:hypothetical protein